MENNFTQKGKPGLLAPETISNWKLFPQSSGWTPSSKEELSEFIPPPASLDLPKRSIRKTGDIKKIFFNLKTYEPFFPILIVLFLGTIAVAMGRRLETKIPANNHDSRPARKTAAPTTPKGQHQSQVETVRKLDTMASQDPIKPVRKNAVSQKPRFFAEPSSEKARYYRDNWSKFLTLTPSRYKHRLFGGIKGLAVTFDNNTDFPVDEVIAEIEYIKANGHPWKTELVPLFHIAPHSERSQEIAKVGRGKRVNIRIEKITSSSLHLHYELNNEN